MIWNNLNKGKCPKEECDSLLVPNGRFVTCEYCDFSMRMSKYMDAIKGKESKAYKAAIARHQILKNRSDNKKKLTAMISEIMYSERKSNLNKMLSRGEITQSQYDSKIKSYKVLGI